MSYHIAQAQFDKRYLEIRKLLVSGKVSLPQAKGMLKKRLEIVVGKAIMSTSQDASKGSKHRAEMREKWEKENGED